jgi:hypothetical protein
MNYKIRITAENQAIVKRIADENGMNPHDFKFDNCDPIYHIKNSRFAFNNQDTENTNDYPELTTEQFIELFDKKETELDKWLRETKAKNLSLEELRDETNFLDTKFYNQVRRQLKVAGTLYQHLFNLWNNQSEWQPQRGDRVLVWDDDEKLAEERIFLAEIKGSILPIVTVTFDYENDFKKENEFETTEWKNMKPLPIEQPKETDFKTKVIELIEGKINDLKGYEKRQIEINEYYNNHSQVASKIKVYNDLINDIKQL